MRALYAAGRPDAAAAWLAVADPGATATLTALGQLASGAPLAVAPFDAAIPGLAERDARQAALLVALANGLGVPAGASADWSGLIDKPHEGTWPSSTLWIDQRRAAATKRVGETVLMTLLLARAGERLSLEPVVLADAVAGLVAVGLESEARALALEAALTAGI